MNLNDNPVKLEIDRISKEVVERIKVYNEDERNCLDLGVGEGRDDIPFDRLRSKRLTLWYSLEPGAIAGVYDTLMTQKSKLKVNINIVREKLSSDLGEESFVFLNERHC